MNTLPMVIDQTEEKPEKEGFLSRLFNPLVTAYNDFKNLYQSELEKGGQEIEYARQNRIQSNALAWMQSGLNDDEALQKMIKFLDKDKAVHAYGKIDASEVLLMVQKIRAGEVTPRVQVELINEPSTLEI